MGKSKSQFLYLIYAYFKGLFTFRPFKAKISIFSILNFSYNFSKI